MTPSRPGARRFESFCTCHRLATLLVGSELADAVHTVKIATHPEPPDKAGIRARRSEKMDKPERPAPSFWSATW